MEIQEIAKLAKTRQNFKCDCCHYICYKKSDYDKHNSTLKHAIRLHGNQPEVAEIQKLAKIDFTCTCGKTFKTNSGLWKHRKSCENKSNIEQEKTDSSLASMFVEMVKQNEEFKKIMMEQTKCILEQNSKLVELANNQSVTNNNNGTINNTMNKFNLNFFLNETCKDAMNIQEFIDYVKVQHSDFENFGKYGYVESMTRIIMRNLMELEVHRRPIHCTDAKREVLYVKDNNVWINDFSREKIIRAIKYIAAKNVKQIPGWMDHNPDSKNTQTKLHDKYMRMVCHSMGGRDEAEDQEYYKKIIHNLAKEVIIDKMK